MNLGLDLVADFLNSVEAQEGLEDVTVFDLLGAEIEYNQANEEFNFACESIDELVQMESSIYGLVAAVERYGSEEISKVVDIKVLNNFALVAGFNQTQIGEETITEKFKIIWNKIVIFMRQMAASFGKLCQAMVIWFRGDARKLANVKATLKALKNYNAAKFAALPYTGIDGKVMENAANGLSNLIQAVGGFNMRFHIVADASPEACAQKMTEWKNQNFYIEDWKAIGYTVAKDANGMPTITPIESAHKPVEGTMASLHYEKEGIEDTCEYLERAAKHLSSAVMLGQAYTKDIEAIIGKFKSAPGDDDKEKIATLANYRKVFSFVYKSEKIMMTEVHKLSLQAYQLAKLVESCAGDTTKAGNESLDVGPAFESDEFDAAVESFEPEMKKLVAKDRNALPDSAFGVVYVDEKTKKKVRKYPLEDSNHVRSAIHYFGKCDAKHKPMLARRILAAAKKFDVHIAEDSEIRKWAKK